ncbi:MAG: metal-dependent hydrolase [Bacteroidota bacterium]
MTAPNHVVGGIVITGIAGSFMGVNILANPWYLVVAAISSILPDIDHTKSLIGKLFYPVARFINRRWGHRTITHSAVCWIMVIMGFNAIVQDRDYCIIFGVAYGTHLLLDMITVQGIPLLYPFKRNSFVLPGERNYRFKTGNLRQESTVFCVLLLSGLWLQPLMKTGFWTQYNRFFGTPTHLVSEYHKTPDLLRVDYEVKDGTEIKAGWGYCLEASESKVVLLDSLEDVFVLDGSKVFIKSVIPSHTDRKLKFEKFSFIEVGVDSLNSLIHDKLIRELEIQANNKFVVADEVKSNFSSKYPNGLLFSTLDVKVEKDPFVPKVSPRIKTLEKRIKLLESQEVADVMRYEQEVSDYDELSRKVKLETDLFERDKLIAKMKSFGSIREPVNNTEKISTLRNEIIEIRALDDIENKTRKAELDAKFQESIPEQTRFTGFVDFVKIS